MPSMQLSARCQTISCRPPARVRGSDPVPLRLMTWNVGNTDSRDPHDAYRLKQQRYEDHRDRVREVAPDVVFLQELLLPTQCASFIEGDASWTCHDVAGRDAAVRRLLGPGYSIACDARGHVECIGVRTSFGAIAVHPRRAGARRRSDPPASLAPCSWRQGECDDERCDAESTVSAVTVETIRGPLRPRSRPSHGAGQVRPRALLGGGSCPIPPAPTGLRWRRRRTGARRPTFEPCGGRLQPRSVCLRGAGKRPYGRSTSARDAAFASDAAAPNAPSTPRAGEPGLRPRPGRSPTACAANCTVHGRGIGPDPGTEPLYVGFDWSALPDGARASGPHRSFCDHVRAGPVARDTRRFPFLRGAELCQTVRREDSCCSTRHPPARLFAGQTHVVTGGGSGIGRCTARSRHRCCIRILVQGLTRARVYVTPMTP